VAAFANSRLYEGRVSGLASFRSHLWLHTDDDRCGAPPFVFREDFSMEDWTRFLVEMPMMFVRGPEGLEAADGMPFSKFMAEGWKGRCATMDDWLLHVTGVFTEARTKTYIELRSADLLPDEQILEVPRFYAGLMYDAQARRAALDLLGWGTPGRRPAPARWREVMEEAARDGGDARFEGKRLGDLAQAARDIARAAHTAAT
jgi:glutamate--cysteine ligase